jgi:transcriptional repressor NrdR
VGYCIQYVVFLKKTGTRCCIYQKITKMECPYCSHDETKVTDKRDNSSVARRRRECLGCGKRFTTYERIEMNLNVVKKNGVRQKFDREKLHAGVFKVMEKRGFESEEIDDVVDSIEMKIYKISKDGDIQSKKIGDLVMAQLKRVDKVAYMRFAAVYKEFETLDDFEEEIRGLKK